MRFFALSDALHCVDGVQPRPAGLLPCNAVIREVESGRVAVELAKPSALMRALGDESLVRLAATADDRLGHALAEV